MGKKTKRIWLKKRNKSLYFAVFVLDFLGISRLMADKGGVIVGFVEVKAA